MAVIPATGEAEAEESLEPGGRGCGELRSRHCSPAWVTKRDSHTQTKKKVIKKIGPGVVAHACDPTLWEAK